MDVGRGEVLGPEEARLGVVLLGDARHDPGDAEAVGAHRHGRRLPVLVEDGEVEGLSVAAAELEDLADLDAAGEFERSGAVGGGVADDDLGGLDRAVGDEVTAGDEVEDVLSVLVGPGDPPGAGDDAGVEEVAQLRRALEAEDRVVEVEAGADVAP